MKNKFLLLTSFYFLFACSTPSSKPPVQGEIVSVLNSNTYQAEYAGPRLRIGDKVKIIEYDLDTNMKQRNSRNVPFNQKKKVIGEATVSSIINDHFYELKSERPQHVPSDALIEKF